MENMSFSIFPNDNFLDLRLYQYGWEQCAPLHSFGPFVRNHFLFHFSPFFFWFCLSDTFSGCL